MGSCRVVMGVGTECMPLGDEMGSGDMVIARLWVGSVFRAEEGFMVGETYILNVDGAAIMFEMVVVMG